MNIKPIKTKKDYEEALANIETLWEAKANTPQGDKLDVLTTLVEAYEQENFEILPPDPVEAIKFRMEQMELSQKDMAVYMGGKNRVSEVLRHKRKLTITMIRNLYKKLNIPAESLIFA